MNIIVLPRISADWTLAGSFSIDFGPVVASSRFSEIDLSRYSHISNTQATYMKLYLKRSLIDTEALCAIPSRIATSIFSILVTVLRVHG